MFSLIQNIVERTKEQQNGRSVLLRVENNIGVFIYHFVPEVKIIVM